MDGTQSDPASDRLNLPDSVARISTPDLVDDPGKFESAKQRKTILLEGIKKFNFKPKKASHDPCSYIGRYSNVSQGIQFLLDVGLIPSRTPEDIARFLRDTDGLSKAMIGEYLGEAYVFSFPSMRY
jgi:brefeldin A-inhibited guanine nucleotide-exchange protein